MGSKSVYAGADNGKAERHRQADADQAHDQPGQPHPKIFKYNRQADNNDTERRQCIEKREWRRDESGRRKDQYDESGQSLKKRTLEDPLPAWARALFKPPDPFQNSRDDPALEGFAELQVFPFFGQPRRPKARDELQAQQSDNNLENMGDTAGW